MRATPSEKMETIRLVEDSELGVKRTLEMIGVPRSISGGENTAMTITTERFQSDLEASNMRRDAGGPGGQRRNIGRIEGDRDRRARLSRLFGALARITR